MVRFVLYIHECDYDSYEPRQRLNPCIRFHFCFCFMLFFFVCHLNYWENGPFESIQFFSLFFFRSCNLKKKTSAGANLSFLLFWNSLWIQNFIAFLFYDVDDNDCGDRSVKFIHCTVRHTRTREKEEEEDEKKKMTTKTTTMKKEMR